MARGNRKQIPIELSLEQSQVTTLVVGSLLGLGVVFLLGVGFGKRLGSAAVGEAAESVAEAAPKGTARTAGARGESAPALTFHDALTSKTIGAAERPVLDGIEPAARPPTKTAAAASGKASSTPAKGEASAARRVVAEAESAAPAQGSPPQAPEKAAAKPKVETAPAGRYAVQVAASQDLAESRRLVEKLEAAGYDAWLAKAEIPGRGTWYRVRIGRFESKEDAAMKQAEIKVALNMNGLVVGN